MILPFSSTVPKVKLVNGLEQFDEEEIYNAERVLSRTLVKKHVGNARPRDAVTILPFSSTVPKVKLVNGLEQFDEEEIFNAERVLSRTLVKKHVGNARPRDVLTILPFSSTEPKIKLVNGLEQFNEEEIFNAERVLSRTLVKKHAGNAQAHQLPLCHPLTTIALTTNPLS